MDNTFIPRHFSVKAGTRGAHLKRFPIILFMFLVLSSLLASPLFGLANASYSDPALDMRMRPMFMVDPSADPLAVLGYSPVQVRAAYNLPSSGGNGTIAIVDAFDAPSIQSELDIFSSYFGLPAANFEEHHMSATMTTDGDWAMETALDVEWAHAIAPDAKILLVQAKSDLVRDLLAAVDYANSRPDVVAVSMSWGTNEFSSESFYDNRFDSTYNAAFFASSGDDGSGVIWPACSINVVAVGGTTLTLGSGGTFISETSWSGSGGGVSAYEPKPSYQTDYGLTAPGRSVPDVSYNANPATGFAVYYNGAWTRVGGTSAGAPQWAAIQALGLTAYNSNIYQAAKSSNWASYFRDITAGSNGDYYAAAGYDLVTGVGSPITMNFEAETTTNTPITLHPAGQSTPLSPGNEFTVSYTFEGAPQTATLQNGTATFTSDRNTNLQIAGTSTASTASEKWVFTQSANPVTIAAGTTSTLYYYDLLSQTATYATSDGSNATNPNATFLTAPTVTSNQGTTQTAIVSLSQTAPETIWPLRGTTVSTTNPIVGNSSEQWTTQTETWTIIAPNQVPTPIIYTHQYQLTITGAPVGSEWFNSGDTANVTFPVVYNRASGTGQRVASYTLDEVTTPVYTSTGNLTLTVLMNGAHQLQVTSTRQYQVSLDASAAAMTVAITPPALSGDSYWYDEGTSVHITLNSVANRTLGTGVRLTSYSVNSIVINVATATPIEMLNLAAITSPQTVTAALTTQYQLSLPSGAVNTVTPPSLPGDSGWYDVATNVAVQYNYTSNGTSDTRTNALSYTINQNTPTTLPRQANGTFQVQLTMTAPQTVNVASTLQYRLITEGGRNVVPSQASLTSDGFYDSGITLSVASDYMWSVNGSTRQALASYTLDGVTTNITNIEHVTFTTPEITFTKPQTIAFNAVTQYLAVFQFTNAAGTQPLTPTTFQLNTSQGILDAPSFQAWLNTGTQFQIASIIWQSTEVKPTNQITYVANGPLNLTVNCNVYNATLIVQDSQGAAIVGAQVTVTLANQTLINTVTNAEGAVDLPMIPQGTFTAAITYQGTTTTVSGNATNEALTTQAISTTPSPSPSQSASPSPSQTSTAPPVHTSTPSPTPAIPEIPSLFALLALMTLAALLALIVKKKTAKN
jgi:hypothetical protein